MKQPEVSICIPTYNYGRYIGEAIESVLAQDFKDYELIIIDDCSDDDTENTVNFYKQHNPSIKFIKNEANVGMVQNWNFCLETARGKYVKFLFADDKLVGNQSIRLMYDSLETYKEAVMVCSARIVIDDHSNPTNTWNCMKEDALVSGREMVRQCLLEQRNIIGEPTAVMFRREIGMRGFDPAYKQLVDLEMWLHLLSRGDLLYLTEPLVAFRQHFAQQSHLNTQSNISLHEMAMLTKRYLKVSFLLEKMFIKPIIDYGYSYKLWKSYKNGKSISDEKDNELPNRKQGGLFYLNMLVYKIVNPLFKVIVKSMRSNLSRRKLTVK